MNGSRLITVALWVLLAIGFLGALKVSYANLAGNHCPHLWLVPICYIVLVAYGLMILSLIVPNMGFKHYFFCIGWGIAFLLAFVGSIAEVMAGGGVCPASGGGGLRGSSTVSVPMCFVSLALTVVILVLFLIGPYKKACDTHNAKYNDT